MERWICWDADHFGQNRHFLTRRNVSKMHLFAGRLVFSISSPISPWYQLHEKPVAFSATAKIMIGHRLGHLNFTLYRKQRGSPNHGVNVNDTRFRAPFRQTRKLNDNDILQRRWAKYLRPRVENIYFFPLSLAILVILFLSLFALVFASLSPFFHTFVSVRPPSLSPHGAFFVL